MIVTEKPIPLKKDNQTRGVLSVPSESFEALKKQGNIPNELTFGARITRVKIISHTTLLNECRLSADLWEHLSIPFESRVRFYAKDDLLHIGPLIGMFTAGFTGNKFRPVGDRSLMFAQYLTTAAKMGGYVFIFGSHVIHWDKSVISGFFYTNEGWKQHDIPFPHVVYDRIPNRKAEQLPNLQEIKKRMETNYFIPWFNSGFFNKWTVYEKLFQHESVSRYVPETFINPPLATVENMLNKYKHVYVKPSNGSLGLGIHQIIKRAQDRHYYCRFQHENTTILKRYSSLKALFDMHFPVDERPHLVVQQGISLMKINNRPLDFRVHTNKNIHGQWQVSALAAKVSGYNRVTTHIANGGKVKTVDELIKEDEAFRPLVNKLRNVTLLLSEVLDAKMDGFNGEIGFDMGIDVNENIWMFEANSKPGRAIFIHPKLKKADIATRKLPFEFGTYLTEVSITKPETLLR